MHIKQITISNFRSFRQQPEIHPFSPGTNSVVGRNGSGKSNLFDAVQFALLSPKFWSLRTVSFTFCKWSYLLSFMNHEKSNCARELWFHTIHVLVHKHLFSCFKKGLLEVDKVYQIPYFTHFLSWLVGLIGSAWQLWFSCFGFFI